MALQDFGLLLGKLEHEIGGESLAVALDLPIELLNLDAIKFRKVTIQHHLNAANRHNALRYFKVALCDHILGGNRFRLQGGFRRLPGLLFHCLVLYHLIRRSGGSGKVEKWKSGTNVMWEYGSMRMRKRGRGGMRRSQSSQEYPDGRESPYASE